MNGKGPAIAALEINAINELSFMVASLDFFKGYGYSQRHINNLLLDGHLDSRSELLVARNEGQIVGLGWFVARGGFDRCGYLRLIAVSSEFQGRGIGQMLLKTIEQRHLDDYGIALLVTKDNRSAQLFYERMGYVQVGAIPEFVRPGRTECIYYKASQT